MTLTARRAQQILRPYGGWMLTDILIDPDAGISAAKGSFYGATGYVVDGARCWMRDDCTRLPTLVPNPTQVTETVWGPKLPADSEAVRHE